MRQRRKGNTVSMAQQRPPQSSPTSSAAGPFPGLFAELPRQGH